MSASNRLRLADGSTITLNTDSRIRNRTEGRILHVEILRGEAVFNMLHNPHRTLIVSAGDLTVIDTSTVFAVRRIDTGGSRVLVEEGEVQLQAAQAQFHLYRNQLATVDPDANRLNIRVRGVSAAEVARQLSWRRGVLTFDCERLGDAVQEINRYNAIKLEIANLSLRDVQVGGVFSPTDPLAFAEATSDLNPDIRWDARRTASGTEVLTLERAPHKNHATPDSKRCTPAVPKP